MSLGEHNCRTLSIGVNRGSYLGLDALLHLKIQEELQGYLEKESEGVGSSTLESQISVHSPYLLFQEEGKDKGIKGNLSGKGYII